MVDAFIRRIEWLSEMSGRVVSWICIVLIFVVTYDVAARYLFNAPTVWSYDLGYMIGGTLMVLGGGYTLLHGGHVRVDVLYARLSTKVQLIVDGIFTVLFFFPLMGVLLYYAVVYFLQACATGEVSNMGIWQPVMWPFRLMFPIGIGLFLLQGIAWFSRTLKGLAKESRP